MFYLASSQIIAIAAATTQRWEVIMINVLHGPMLCAVHRHWSARHAPCDIIVEIILKSLAKQYSVRSLLLLDSMESLALYLIFKSIFLLFYIVDAQQPCFKTGRKCNEALSKHDVFTYVMITAKVIFQLFVVAFILIFFPSDHKHDI